MGRGALRKIKPMFVEEIAPEEAEVIGRTPQGKLIFRRKRVRGRNVPLEVDGQRVWETHPTTAKPLYPRNRLVRYEEEHTFTLQQDGQFNLYMEDYRPPSAEELEAERKKLAAAKLLPSLAEALVEEGIDVNDFMAFLKGKRAEEAAEVETDEPGPNPSPKPTGEDQVTYPAPAGVGRWKLSNGETIQGKKEDALKAEAALHKGDPEL